MSTNMTGSEALPKTALRNKESFQDDAVKSDDPKAKYCHGQHGELPSVIEPSKQQLDEFLKTSSSALVVVPLGNADALRFEGDDFSKFDKPGLSEGESPREWHPEELMTHAQVARFLGKSVSGLHDWRNPKSPRYKKELAELAIYISPRSVRFRRKDIVAWVATQGKGGVA